MKTNIILIFTAVLFIYCSSACSSGNNRDKAVDSIESMEDSIGRSPDTLVTGADKALDTSFAVTAADAGLTEVETGKLAIKKGQAQGVKDFGQMMVEDHGKANAELKAIAAKKNIVLPTQPSAKHQEDIKRLQTVSGKEFDKTYADMMVSSHEEALQVFEKAAQTAADIDLKNFASKTLPVLEKHLREAQALQQQ